VQDLAPDFEQTFPKIPKISSSSLRQLSGVQPRPQVSLLSPEYNEMRETSHFSNLRI